MLTTLLRRLGVIRPCPLATLRCLTFLRRAEFPRISPEEIIHLTYADTQAAVTASVSWIREVAGERGLARAGREHLRVVLDTCLTSLDRAAPEEPVVGFVLTVGHGGNNPQYNAFFFPNPKYTGAGS